MISKNSYLQYLLISLTGILISLSINTPGYGQRNTPNNHYYFNPYLLNPSYIGGHTEIFINHRKQWSEIVGAPTTSAVNIQHSFSHKMGMGLLVENDVRGVLNTTRVLGTFGYRVYFGHQPSIYNMLSFGISAGIDHTGIDLEQVENVADPAVLNALNRTNSLDGSFGVHYQRNQLQIGFALPRLFKTEIISTDRFNYNELNIEQLKYSVTSLRYQFSLSHELTFEPWLLYRTSNKFRGQLEGLGVLHVKELAWVGVGAGYRQNYSAFFLLGLKIADKYRFGYAYEVANKQASNIGQGTHEFQLSIKLGIKNKLAGVTPTEAKRKQAIQKNPENPADSIQENKYQIKEDIVHLDESQHDESPADTGNQVNGTSDQYGMEPGYYIVVGVFGIRNNAEKHVEQVNQAGYPVSIYQHRVKKHYYVSFEKTDNKKEAEKLRDKIRAKKIFEFSDAWLLRIR